MKIVKESLVEGVADSFLKNRFGISGEFDDFEDLYNFRSVERNKLIRINDKAYVVKNPSNLDNHAHSVRGFIDKEGNIYLSLKNNCIHYTIYEALVLKDILPHVDKWWFKLPLYFIGIQRVKDTDIIAMGESNMLLSDPNPYTFNQVKTAYLNIINKAKKKNPNLNIVFKPIFQFEYDNTIVKESLEYMSNIPTFEEIVDMSPDIIKSYILKCKETPQSVEWHPEGNVYNHLKIVYNRAKTSGDINLALTALFHDLGKADTTKPSEKKLGAWPSHGHENISAILVNDNKDWIVQMGGDPELVYYLVKQHMRIKNMDQMKRSKQQELLNNKWINYLKTFSTYDDMTNLRHDEK